MNEERTVSLRADTEQRTATIEVEDVRTEGRTLHGFAALYGAESRDLGGFVETIEPGAFTEALAGEPDVLLTFNHSPDRVLARTTSGTLQLRDEERGLAFEAELGDGPTAQDVRDMVRRGDLSGASFRFVVAPGGETWQGERRTLTKIAQLIDVSLATTPAYDGPRVELRTHNSNAAEERQEDNMETEDRQTSGGLAVEDRQASTPATPRGLAD
jgi:HK97 family phage prohead protease